MKNLKLSAVLLLMSIFVFSCTDNMTTPDQNVVTESIIGDYDGNLRDINNTNIEYPAEVSIERVSEYSIQMTLHCEIMDTIIGFDLYENNDSLMVCFNDEDFEEHYGHGRAGMHHMMGDDESHGWMHHLDEDHEQGERHFGGFDMEHHTFNYDFYSEDNQEWLYRFEGTKKVK